MSAYEAISLISLVISIVTAAFALLPKIWNWAVDKSQGPKVNISAQDSIGISHHLGRIFFFLRIQIENTGRRPVAISKIDCVIRQGDVGQANWGEPRRFPATVYYSELESSNGEKPIVFVGTIRLKPGESWARVVRAYGTQNQANEEEALDIDDEFNQALGEIENQRRQEGGRDTSILTIKDDNLISRAQDFARANFNLIVGRYSIYIATIGDDNELLAVVKYSFSITERNRLTLTKIIDEYQHGTNGLPYARHGIEPRLSEPSTGENVRKEYLAIIGSQ